MNCSVLEESRRRVVVIGQNLPHQGVYRPWPILLDQPACRFRAEVTLIVQDEAARVLDTHCGNFYALDPIGTRMLFATLEAGSEAMVRTLAHAYQIPETQVRADWGDLVEGMRQAKLTETAAPGDASKSRTPSVSSSEVPIKGAARLPPGRFKVWVWLTLAWLSFWLLGWERTLRIWGGRPRRQSESTPAACAAIVADLDRLVRRSASRHLLNPQCKERSLVSWHLLRRMGLPARLAMGVMLYPFTAHAWTECAGHIVGDERSRCEQFVTVAIYE